VRTAKAFGTQQILVRKYEDYALRARKADIMAAIYQGTGMGSMIFVVSKSLAQYL
jgi:hypothetical protein